MLEQRLADRTSSMRTGIVPTIDDLIDIIQSGTAGEHIGRINVHHLSAG